MTITRDDIIKLQDTDRIRRVLCHNAIGKIVDIVYDIPYDVINNTDSIIVNIRLYGKT
jgi:hypothetical protein